MKANGGGGFIGQSFARFIRETACTLLFAAAVCGAAGAFAAGTDGLNLTTNDWYDANFTALPASDTAIAQGDTTGITLGAGSWTAVPATGTAKIVADEDDGNATVLAVDAAGEELEFTPAALQSATGMETAAFKVKAEALDTLTAISDAQAAFTLYSADGETFSFMGYVSDGVQGVWTNLTGVAADVLVNTWYDLTMDFCGENSARVVRFAVNGTVLSDSEGTTWFPVVKQTATTIGSVSFAGVGSLKSFSGDSLAEAAVARYNGTDYPSVAAAIAAGEADSWANGAVTLLADAEWTPTASGTYNIDAAGHTLTIDGASYTASGTAYTISREFYWIGGNTDNTQLTLTDAANWSRTQGGPAAAEYPGAGDLAIFATASQAKIAGGSTFAANIGIRANTTLHTQSASATGTLTGDMMIDSGVTATLLANHNTATTLASKGAVCGEGVLQCSTRNNGWIELHNNFTNFQGKVVLSSQTSFQPSPAIWPVDASAISLDSSAKNSSFYLLRQNSTLYKFGALNGYIETKEDASGVTYGKRAGLEIGARDEDSSVWGAWYPNSSKNYVNGLYWVAPNATLTYAITNAYEITVSKGGTIDIPDVHCITNVVFASNKNDSDYGVHSTNHTACQLYFDDLGGYFVYTGEEAHDSAIASRIASIAETAFAGFDNDADVTLDLSAKSSVFAGKALKKKGAGALTLTGVSSHGAVALADGSLATDATTLGAVTLADDTAIEVPSGATLASLSAGTDAKVKIDITALAESDSEQDILTVTDGANLADVVEIATNTTGYAYVFSGLDTGAVKVTVSRKPETFVWAGANGAKWSEASNWTVGGETPDAAPTEIDTVVFQSNAEVDLANGGANINFKTLDITGVRVLVTGGTLVMNDGTISETGTLALSNATFRAMTPNSSTAAYVTNTFEFVSESANTIIPPAGTKLYFDGALTGSGSFSVEYVSGNYPSVEFRGTAENFCGTATIPATGKSEQTRFWGLSNFSNSYWNVYARGSANSGYKYLFCATNNSTAYHFGGIDATVPDGDYSTYGDRVAAIYAGYIARDSYLGGTLAKTYGTDIHWVANANTLTLNASGSGKDVKSIFIDGTGTVVLKSVKSIPTTRIVFGAAGGTLKFTSDVPSENRDISGLLNQADYENATITYENAEGETDVWATALNSTNKGGLVKNGEGTLVLGAAPQYSGDTYLDGGTLKIPAAAGVAVKTTVPGKSVRRTSEKIGEVEYTVYTLGARKSTMVLIY